ncbi:MAG: DUF4258 domain-containing protein [Acidobacteriota bacterium]
MIFTKHFKKMMKERSIRQEWIDRTLKEPQKIERHEDGTQHFLCQIQEHGNRWLRIIVDAQKQPHRAVTVFFD